MLEVNKDYHFAMQFDAKAHVVNVFLNGEIRASFEVRNLAPEGSVGIDLDSTVIGLGYTGYLAEFTTTLQCEYPKRFFDRSEWGTKIFNPVSGWGRKLVEGPKAALKTLGVTTTGLFSWIAQENPFQWSTAFGSDLFHSFSQQLALDTDDLEGGHVLSWDSANNRFVGAVANMAGNSTVKKSPGTFTALVSALIAPELYKPHMSVNTGLMRPALAQRFGSDIPSPAALYGGYWTLFTRFGSSRLLTRDYTYLGLPTYLPPTAESATRSVIPPTSLNASSFNDTADMDYVYDDYFSVPSAEPIVEDKYHTTIIKIRTGTRLAASLTTTSGNIRISSNSYGRLYFRVTFEIPRGDEDLYPAFNVSDRAPNEFQDFVFDNALREGAITWNSERGLIKPNSETTVVISTDFVEGRLQSYVNGRKTAMLNVEADGVSLIPGRAPLPDPQDGQRVTVRH